MNGIKLICFILFTIWSLGTNAGVYASTERVESEAPLIAAAQLTSYPAGIRSKVNEIIQKGIRPEDLNFSPSKQEGYNPSGKYAVFGENGGADYRTLPFGILEDHIPHKADGHAVFTSANKIFLAGTEVPEILYIVWPVKEDVCTATNYGLGLAKNAENDYAETHRLINPPSLAEKSDNPVTLQFENSIEHPSPFACVQDANGVRYYYHTLVER